MFILSFSIPFVCLVVILLILSVIHLWDLATAHSPSGKEPKPSPQEDARFSGRCIRHTNFTLSCVFPLWDSTTAHYFYGKELTLIPLEESCFSGLIVVQCSHITLPELSFLVLAHITH